MPNFQGISRTAHKFSALSRKVGKGLRPPSTKLYNKICSGLATGKRLASRTGKLRPKRLNADSWRLLPRTRATKETFRRLVRWLSIFYKRLTKPHLPLFYLILTIIGLLVWFSVQVGAESIRLDNPTPYKAPVSPLKPLESTKLVEQSILAAIIKQPKWGSCGTSGYLGGQCVYGIAKWICVPQNMGNANEWDEYARRNGITVSSVPKIGSVAQSDAGRYGHVTLVLKVEGGSVYTRGMNEAGPWSIRESWSPVSSFEYIYFN